MTYSVNPLDPTTPTNIQGATQGAEELRALKQSVNSRFASTGTGTNNAIPTRQTVLQGLLSSGQPALFAAGTGLNVDLKASVTACILAFAGGFTGSGALDLVEQLNSDVASYWAGVPANVTSYLAITRASAGVTAAAQTLAPPQWRDTYDRQAQSVLQFAGAAGATTFLDDFGNTWTAQAGAKVQTNSFKFGSGGLGGGGAANSLNGTTDFIKSSDFKTLGGQGGVGSWSMRCWVNPQTLPGLGVVGSFMGVTNAAGQGAYLAINNAGGTIRFMYSLSSDGSTNNIANQVAGTTLPVVGTWYFIELVYDFLAGTYRLYVNGAQEASTASAGRINGLTQACIGAASPVSNNLNCYIDKPEILPYCQHPNGTAYAVPTGAPSITAAGYASDWFDTNTWTMKTLSAASASAGTDPTFTTSNKVYVGECDTSGAAVSAVRVYRYRGRYEPDYTNSLPGVATLTSFNHNLGVMPNRWELELLCLKQDQNYQPGDRLRAVGAGSSADFPVTLKATAKTLSFTTGNTTAIRTIVQTTGTELPLTAASWAYRMIAYRD